MTGSVEHHVEMCGVDCSKYIGIVSRQLPSVVGLSESRVHVISECQIEMPVGSYLVIESRDGSKRYLARVVESTIQDVYAIAKMPVLSLEQELLVDVRPLPRLVAMDLVVECRDDVCTAPVTPVEIHSLVRFPEPGEVTKMLGLPRDGIHTGSLALPDGRPLPGEDVYLPETALRHHVLVVGTTGSGKTVFLKNLIYELLKNRLGRAVVLDIVGHYHHLLSREIASMCVILPVTSRYARKLRKLASTLIDEVDVPDTGSPYKTAAQIFALALVEDYVDRTFRSCGIKCKIRKVKVSARARASRENEWIVVLRYVDAHLEIQDLAVRVRIYPWALETADVLTVLPKLSAVFTAQARMFYRKVVTELLKEFLKLRTKSSIDVYEDKVCEISRRFDVKLRELYDFLLSTVTEDSGGKFGKRSSMVYEIIAERIGVHKGTVENMLRGFLSLVETDLFDVQVETTLEIEDDGKARVHTFLMRFCEPDYDELFRSEHYVVIDLRDCTSTQQKLVVYRVLEKLYRFVDRNWHKLRLGTVLIAIDEAHTFFPQTREESEKELIESYLTMLARLGRARGIGLVFATHSPDDLNDLVLQLTNTKIILRSEEKILEKLGVPSQERRTLMLAPPGLAYIRSFVYKMPIFVKLEPAKTIHVG